MMDSLVDQYINLVGKHLPGPQDTHNVDQTIGLIHDFAKSAGLNLRDEATLRTVIRAHILITAFTVSHIASVCKDNPACLEASLGHSTLAAGQLGALLKEIAKFTAVV